MSDAFAIECVRHIVFPEPIVDPFVDPYTWM
jgi:hypothetical protein